KALVTVNWALPDPLNVERNLSLQVLYQILLGSPASPLYKALLDSELGEDIAGLGLDTDAYQMIFSTGMRGVALEDAGKVEETILETLQNLVKDGIDPLEIEAAMNTYEFSLREYNTGGFPRGLAMMFTSLSSWLYGGDPLAPLSYESTLAGIKEKLATDKHYFEKLIDDYLLKNSHRSTILLEPDSDYRKRLEAQERARLDAYRANLSDKDIETIVAETHRLRQNQEAPDDPEAIAK
ncbi:MAG: insulinase family protein, partial [Anaerolineae bacterium]|nr:insulinase family protein [Anaerolineae bacterium]